APTNRDVYASRDRRSGAATEMAKLIPEAMRTADSRTRFDQASTTTKANAASTTTTSTQDTPISPRRPTLSKPTVLARPLAHHGGRTSAGMRTVSGEFGAPATTAIAK